MSTTFVGIELREENGRRRHAAVVLRRRKGSVELQHWACLINSDEELLEYLVEMAGKNGVIATHGGEPDAADLLHRRIWRVLDYRLLFALAPRHRTRALVRVEPGEVHRAFASNPAPLSPGVLESVRALVPAVDFLPLTQSLGNLPPGSMLQQQYVATTRAALCAYAGLWCWWHGPAGYDVLGDSAHSYRLAPRMMDYEPDIDARPF